MERLRFIEMYSRAERDFIDKMKKLERWHHYHNERHALGDVVPAIERICKLENIDLEKKILIKTAGIYHDIGFLDRYENNEEVAAEYVKNRLPVLGYKKEQADKIAKIILATKMPQNPFTLDERVMCDATLDNIGRNDFFYLSEMLRREREGYFGEPIDIMEWAERNLKFLERHKYFTEASRKMRESGKQKNLLLLKKFLGKPINN